jgi:signal transduction histidine kinase
VNRPLRALRLRLTAWYVATSALVLLVLGSALLLAIGRRVSAELEATLQQAVQTAADAARIRANTGERPEFAAATAVRAIATPGRILYLFDAAGLTLVPEQSVDARIVAAARDALRSGRVSVGIETEAGEAWRLYGERVTLRGRTFVIVALADAAVGRRQFERIIESFLAAGLLAVILTAAGGWFVSGVSAAPVERVFEQRRRFMAEAAHELRTPLAVLRGQADIALERPPSAEADREALRAIAGEAERMASIVDDLLTLARAEAGERPLRAERLFLDDVAVDVVRAASPLAARRDVRLDMGRYEEAALTGDPERVRQLTAILVDNAVKFTPPGGSIRVDAFRSDPGGAVLVVEDTGVGIPESERERVFDRFFRGSSSAAEIPGAGLGLAIARWIADAHGATITLETPAVGGTRVTVRFPPAAVQTG